MNFAGIDLGTNFTKTHTGFVFASGISYENTDMANNVMTAYGRNYAMGLFNKNSKYGINLNKGLNENLKLNYLYALWNITKGDMCEFQNVVVGLPASQWKAGLVTNQFKDLLTIEKPTIIKVNGKEKLIHVKNVGIVPEGCPAYYAMDYGRFNGAKTLLIDWGSLTINQCLFQNDEMIDTDTDEDGVLKIYQRMANKINSVLGTNVEKEDMFDILQNGLIAQGENIDMTPIIAPIADDYCERVYNKLKLRWSVDTIRYVPLVGAGSIVMGNFLKCYIKQAELQKNAQILAAIGMEEMAREC